MKYRQLPIEKIGIAWIAAMMIFMLPSCNENTFSEISFPPLISSSAVKANALDSLVQTKHNVIEYTNKDANNFLYYFAYPVFNEMLDQSQAFIQSQLESISSSYKLIYGEYAYTTAIYSGEVFWPENIAENPMIVKSQAGNKIEVHTKGVLLEELSQQEKTTENDLYGTKYEAALYEKDDVQLYVYPTISGFTIETTLKEAPVDNTLQFIVQANDPVVKSNNFYAAFGNPEGENDFCFIVQETGTKHADKELCHYSMTNKKNDDGSYTISIILPEDAAQYPMTTSITFEQYTSKTIIDSQAFSGSTQKNAYLKSYAVLGTDGQWGSQRSFIRFSTSQLPSINPNDILSVSLGIKMLDGTSDAAIAAYNLSDSWCSWTLNWDTMPEMTTKTSESEVSEDGYFHLDITKLFKDNLNGNLDAITEVGIGLMAKDEQNDHIEIASADNCTYPIYYAVTYKSSNK